jgi:hypothetical protein
MVKAVTELDNFYMSEKERAIRNWTKNKKHWTK